MINRDLTTVYIKALTEDTDAYGRFVEDEPVASSMAVYPYQQSNTEDIRYVDVELVGVTYANIEPSNIVVIGDDEYIVKFVQKARRKNIAYLQKQGA